MSEKAGQFRGAAFGGFHRQDVLDYLEKMARERQEEREAQATEKAGLLASLEEERAARARAEKCLALLENRASETTGAQKELEDVVARLKEELAEKEALLARSKVEAEELRRQITTLEPGAQSWKRIKDTAGDIEVAAHERAQITIQGARVRAAEIRAEVIRWVLDVQGRCDDLQQDLRTSIQGAETQLDHIRTSFDLTEAHVQGFQSALANLVADTDP